MKKNIIIILGIVLSIMNCYAQNGDPAKISTSDINWNDTIFSVEQTKFNIQ